MKFYSQKLKKLLVLPLLSLLVACSSGNALVNNNLFFNPDTVKAQRFDTGKMWTFEDAPKEYFKETYNFEPTDEWFDDVRLSAIKFANWCSSSFVSADGLVMTNHHCIEMISDQIQKDGENIKRDGFYAKTLEEERKVPNLFVDQLVLIEDVTSEIQSAIDNGKDAQEKIKLRDEKIKELTKKYSEETGLICKVTTLYHGGKYSLYGYRRYNDVRAVFFNKFDTGLYGGDPDNFTYPRYNADFAFLRVYDENGKPLKTDHYFKFSKNGAQYGEPVFVVGNPGTTKRLKTVSQLEYMRDYDYRYGSKMLNDYQKALEKLMKLKPEKAEEYKSMTFFIANSAKVYRNMLKVLRDPYIMARKKAFEKEFKSAVMSNPELREKFGNIWDDIAKNRAELREFSNEMIAYSINPRFSVKYFVIAKKLIKLAKEALKNENGKISDVDTKVESVFPAKLDKDEEIMKLAITAELIEMFTGKDNEVYSKTFGGYSKEKAAEYAINNSDLTSKEKIKELVEKGADVILNSNDPFINFVLMTNDKVNKYKEMAKEIGETEQVLENQLGQALFAVYGTTIPPDATFTLRISDGLLKGYNYNGTVAPAKTTFYGLYDRYYSHEKKEPWNLPEEWVNPKEGFNYSTPYNFVATADIVGGNSGSPVINKNKEIVGVAFDGNIESLSGTIIFTTEGNRMVSVASEGMLEILKNIYGAERLYNELVNGKIK